MTKILNQFHSAVIQYFKDETEFNDFLNAPSHLWGSKPRTSGYRTPKEWLVESRRPDRLTYAIDTVKSLKTNIGII